MRIICTLVLATAALIRIPLLADDTESSKQLDRILIELQKIRMILESGQLQRDVKSQPKVINLDVKDAALLGSKDALLTIVEFTDYECPYCKQFARQTFNDLKKNFIDSQKIRFYVMDLPLPIHRNALLGAQAARCAGEQGQFWPMYDRLHAESEELNIGRIIELAKKSDIMVDVFQECIESGKYRNRIQQDIQAASNGGIQGTPAFIIGRSTETGVEGELVLGAVPYGIFQQKLKQFSEPTRPDPSKP